MPLRFSAIKNGIPNISQRMLTLTLRNLEQDGLVTRHYFAEFPPRVELTPRGRTLLPAREGFTAWIRDNRQAIERSRPLVASAARHRAIPANVTEIRLAILALVEANQDITPAEIAAHLDLPFATMLPTHMMKLVVSHGDRRGELYDLLHADPNETRNLWDDPNRLKEKCQLLQRLCDRMAYTVDPLPLRHAPW